MDLNKSLNYSSYKPALTLMLYVGRQNTNVHSTTSTLPST